MHILLVDDSPAVRARLAQLLREDDAIDSVDEASCAEEALVSVRARSPDVIVLDLNMPVVSGLSILPMLKELEPIPLVIVLTNHPSEHHEREARARGADFFFDKSNDFVRVAEIISARATARRNTTTA